MVRLASAIFEGGLDRSVWDQLKVFDTGGVPRRLLGRRLRPAYPTSNPHAIARARLGE